MDRGKDDGSLSELRNDGIVGGGVKFLYRVFQIQLHKYTLLGVVVGEDVVLVQGDLTALLKYYC